MTAHNHSLNVGLDVQVHEADVGVVLLAVGHEGDEGLGDSMTHPPTQTVHMGFVEANRFQEWRLRPEEFIHNVLEGRKLRVGTGMGCKVTLQVGENFVPHRINN